MSETQQALIHNPVYVSVKNQIEEATTTEALNGALASFQSAYKTGELNQTETALLVTVGRWKRSELSKAETKKSTVRQSLEKATYQGIGGVPRPNPHLMEGDEHQLYRTIVDLNPELPDAFTTLEKLELWYMERERSDYGKKWLVPAVTQKLREIESAWAKKAEVK